MSKFAAAILAAAASSPIIDARAPVVKGRVLLIDGDAIAYNCAGNDECDPGQARINALNKIERAMQRGGCESVKVLVTGRGSHKGHRYAVARVKPYQGQREGSRRPKNWEYLRGWVEAHEHADLSTNAEADDLFRKYGVVRGWENVVIHTQDKDMRMCPGRHLTWSTLELVTVPEGTYDLVAGGLQYGLKWFWLQMLMGDAADNIPGLPKYVNDKGNLAQCGEKTAEKLLALASSNEEAKSLVRHHYKAYYGDEWDIQFLEQAVLLWMRRKPGNVFDVLDDGGAIGEPMPRAQDELMKRVAEAQAFQGA